MEILIWKDNLLYENDKLLDLKSPFYKIIEKYKIPKNLIDVKIIKQTLEEADNGLVYTGKFPSGNTVFFYGIEHVRERSKNKNATFIKVYKVYDKLLSFCKKITNTPIDSDMYNIYLAILILSESAIRLGSWKYYKNNGTYGLLTLKKKHFKTLSKKIKIEFEGKKKVKNILYLSDYLTVSELNKKLERIKNSNSFIFENLTEYKLNKFLKKFDITAKDIRTFGVNFKFLEEIIKRKDILSTKTKLVIKESILETSKKINHTASISKKSYLSDEILELLLSDKIKDYSSLTLKSLIFLIINNS